MLATRQQEQTSPKRKTVQNTRNTTKYIVYISIEPVDLEKQ